MKDDLSRVIHLVREDGSTDVSAGTADAVMSTSLLTVTEDAPIREVRGLMAGLGVHHVPVVDREGGVAGVVDADLVVAAADQELAGEVARRHVTVTVAPGDSLRFVAARLTEHGVDVAAVTTYDGRLVGLVTDRDIVAAVGGQPPRER